MWWCCRGGVVYPWGRWCRVGVLLFGCMWIGVGWHRAGGPRTPSPGLGIPGQSPGGAARGARLFFWCDLELGVCVCDGNLGYSFCVGRRRRRHRAHTVHLKQFQQGAVDASTVHPSPSLWCVRSYAPHCCEDHGVLLCLVCLGCRMVAGSCLMHMLRRPRTVVRNVCHPCAHSQCPCCCVTCMPPSGSISIGCTPIWETRPWLLLARGWCRDKYGRTRPRPGCIHDRVAMART